MDAPPPDVLTALLRGGPYESLMFEIGDRQTEINLGPKNLIEGAADLPVARYQYSGHQDDDGNAIFTVDG